MQRLRSSLPPMSTLRPFEAAVRLGSFKAAADELHLTQSAISHQINSLENHFRTKLFFRQGNKLVLTKNGAAYGAAIVQILAELSKAGELFSQKGSDRVLRVSASPSFAMFAALPYVEEFKSRNASLDLRFESRNTDVDFDIEPIDAAIQVGAPPFHGLQAHRLFQSRIRPLAHRSLLEKCGPVKTPRDLARMLLIELNKIPGLWDRWFANVDRSIEVRELRLSSDSLLAAVQMAESGVGVLLAPFPLMTALVSAGHLEVLVPQLLPIDRPDFHLLYRHCDAGSAKIKAIRSWLTTVSADMESKANAAHL
jgi:LysR family transcriptional regulator, glycine cleavage system transcriptional activator